MMNMITLEKRSPAFRAARFGGRRGIISGKHPSRGFQVFLSPLYVLMLAVMLGLAGCGVSDLQFPTEYQAVFMDNGEVFFGKVEDTASPFLTLREVFYVQRRVGADKDKKDVINVLIKRGNEWHGPSFMRINREHVLIIEPVAADSRVAQLMRDAKTLPTAGSQTTTPPTAAPPATTPPASSPPAAAPKR